MSAALDRVLAAIAETAGRPFERALSLPAEAYTNAEVTALEVERLFRADWVCIGREDEIPEPGGYIAHRVAGVPVAALRQPDGSVRAFVNICRHRSAELLAGVGRVGRIVCPYHAWSYDTDGTLRAAPFMGAGFRAQGVALKELRLDRWEGWLYVTLDADAAPISARLAGLSARIAPYRMADHAMAWRAEETWACNWKTLAENFTESYHLFSSHRETLQPFTPTQGVRCEPGEAGWNIHWMDTTRPQKAAWPEADDGARARFPLAHVYPSHVVSVSLDRGFWMSLQPEGPDRVRVLWGVTVARPLWPGDEEGREAMRADIRATFDRINLEDRAIVESIARSLKSGRAAQGRLGEKERTIWEFQRFLARALGPAAGRAAA